MTDDDKLFLKRLNDLDRMASNKGYPVFSDFLSVNEYSLFLDHKKTFICDTMTFDSIPLLERQMVAFIPDAFVFNREYPIKVIAIKALNGRFAESLTHRDILGTIMGLSIERRLVGDIFLSDKEYYVLAHEKFAEMIIDEVRRIRHTDVRCEIVDSYDLDIKRNSVVKYGTLASDRLDCFISECNNCSRSQSLKLIQDGLIFVNGKQILHNSNPVYSGDIISIRHVGKFKIINIGDLSKKGKLKVEYEKYM